jgi:hypothetical protein
MFVLLAWLCIAAGVRFNFSAITLVGVFFDARDFNWACCVPQDFPLFAGLLILTPFYTQQCQVMLIWLLLVEPVRIELTFQI